VPEARTNAPPDISSGLRQFASQILVYTLNPAAASVMLAGQGAQQQSERLAASDIAVNAGFLLVDIIFNRVRHC